MVYVPDRRIIVCYYNHLAINLNKKTEIPMSVRNCFENAFLESSGDVTQNLLHWLKHLIPVDSTSICGSSVSTVDLLTRDGCAKSKFSLADGSKATGPIGKIEKTMKIQGNSIDVVVWVLVSLNVDMILGAHSFDQFGAVIDFPACQITFKTLPHIKPLKFALRRSQTPQLETAVRSVLPFTLPPHERVTVPGSLADLTYQGSKFDVGFATNTSHLLQLGIKVGWDIIDLRDDVIIGGKSMDNIVAITLENVTGDSKIIDPGTIIAMHRPCNSSNYHLINLVSEKGLQLELASRMGVCDALTAAYGSPVLPKIDSCDYHTATDLHEINELVDGADNQSTLVRVRNLITALKSGLVADPESSDNDPST